MYKLVLHFCAKNGIKSNLEAYRPVLYKWYEYSKRMQTLRIWMHFHTFNMTSGEERKKGWNPKYVF